MKTAFKRILLIIIIVIAILSILFMRYQKNEKNEKYLKNSGFVRNYSAYAITPTRHYDLEDGYYAIISSAPKKAVIRKIATPEIFFFEEDYTKKTQILPLKNVEPSNIFDISFNNFDSSVFDIFCPNEKKIIEYNHVNNSIKNTITSDFSFSNSIRCNKNQFLITQDSITRQKYGNGITYFRFATIDSGINGKLIAGDKSSFSFRLMSEDGMILKWKSKFVYVKYYSNSFYVINSSLTQYNRFRTIDTITTDPQTVSLKNNSIIKFKEAPRPVNRLARINDSFLYIISLVKAANDEQDVFKNHTIIDVYDLNSGLYRNSYLFNNPSKNNELLDFYIKDSTLTFLYKNKLIINEFN